MAKRTAKRRPWTKEEVRMLKMLAREQTKTTVIARKLKRSVVATQHKASALGVTLGGGRGRKRV
jgi:SH3-like domain-containing protein